MNLKRIIILIAALIVLAMIVWYDLPLEFPWLVNSLILFFKLSVALAVTVFAYILAGGKKPS
jgi:hypothetical protein